MAVDPAAENMAAAARAAAHEKLDNILFVQAAAESAPELLAGVAAEITILFPWGSLLRALAAPETETLCAIAGLGAPGARVTALINMSVFADAAYCRRVRLPCPPVLRDAARTRAAYGAAGLSVRMIDPQVRGLPYRTSWGVRLVKGAQRRVLRLDARVGDA